MFIRRRHLNEEMRLLFISTCWACDTHVSGMLIMVETVATTRLLKKDSFITGYHVYKTIWTHFLTETLSVETEDNQYDKYAVAALKAGMIVGHVPQSMSKVSFFFSMPR